MIKRMRRFTLLLLLLSTLLCQSGATALAYTNEGGNPGVTVEEPEPSPSPTPAPTPAPTPEGQITPDGNLSLVDDLDYSARGGLQFMTVTTRNGHVYYIVIDRTANSQNVYFLNQVDEYDLMNVLSDGDKEQLEKDKASTPQPKPQNVVAVQPVETAKPSGAEQQRPAQGDLDSDVIRVAFFAGLALLVVLGYYILKIRPQKQGAFDDEEEVEEEEEYENEDEDETEEREGDF